LSIDRSRKADKALAPYAVDERQSRGRLVPEAPSPTRSLYARDRDRILHSTAFRRLTHKTQVFIYHEGDHYRTRLTHSLEVAQIARSMARTLRVDEDLAEALALAHDLGHPPFGHAGERALDAAMTGEGGFDHNAQSLRVVTELERKYARFDGLNLAWETLEGLVKHNGPLTAVAGRPVPQPILSYCAKQDLALDTYASVEAQLAALADDIAYNNHDVDDGYRGPVVAFSAAMSRDLEALRAFLVARVYRHARIARVMGDAERVVSDLFGLYRAHPEALPPEWREQAPEKGYPRYVCDFIAGMTDRYALVEHRRLFDATPELR
jgi:dGTPase